MVDIDPFDLERLEQLLDDLREYEEDYADALTWGGPTIYPDHPITPARARKLADILERVLPLLTVD